jgi:hypothetical protein
MTEYEIIDLLQTRFSEMGQVSALYFTVVSAYLAAAYIVGSKLSRNQLFIISTLYVLWATGTITSIYGAMTACVAYQTALVDLGSIYPETGGRLVIYTSIFMAMQSIGILVSLYFMWSVRQPQNG